MFIGAPELSSSPLMSTVAGSSLSVGEDAPSSMMRWAKLGK
jgi:hypothetical protein